MKSNFMRWIGILLSFSSFWLCSLSYDVITMIDLFLLLHYLKYFLSSFGYLGAKLLFTLCPFEPGIEKKSLQIKLTIQLILFIHSSIYAVEAAIFIFVFAYLLFWFLS